jgi:lipopolysaccharide/colanic/teichoic acid biosynthesis glycosyltransferase/carbonic anhydrase/acetyltransferase-like protein (isoleucine patch superfamily)
MRAILVIPRQTETPCPTVACLPLFPLMDRPFLQHVVEALVGRGVLDIHVVCGAGAEAVEPFLGDGARWGCSFSYHLLGDPERPAGVLRALAAEDGPVLLARADCLPALPATLVPSGRGTLFGTPDDWSGWAVVEAGELGRVAAVPLAELGRHLGARGLDWVEVGQPVVLRALSDVPAAQRAFFRDHALRALVAAREVQPGVWLARNVRVAPKSVLRPPAFVGENTVVGPGVRVGPFAVVGPDCMLDRDSGVHDTTVCAGTYVGPGVQLDGVIVDASSLINPRQATVAAIDPRLLDRLAPVVPLTTWPWRVLAASAFVLTLPVALLVALWLRLTRAGPVFWPRSFVRAPVGSAGAEWEIGTVYTFSPPRPEEDEYGWVVPASLSGLVLELLPALWCVARGNLRLVGVPPRGPELLQAHGGQCPPLLQASPGLITELALCGQGELIPEDCLLVDAYQTQASDSLANAKRIGRFLLRALTNWAGTRAALAPAVAIAGMPPDYVEPRTRTSDLAANGHSPEREPPEGLAL